MPSRDSRVRTALRRLLRPVRKMIVRLDSKDADCPLVVGSRAAPRA